MVLENLQYLPLLQLHSRFQLVVLDYNKNDNNSSSLVYLIKYVIDLCNTILSHLVAVNWLNVTYIF